MDEQRKQFEKWGAGQKICLERYFDDGEQGDYIDICTEWAWVGWVAGKNTTTPRWVSVIDSLPREGELVVFAEFFSGEILSSASGVYSRGEFAIDTCPVRASNDCGDAFVYLDGNMQITHWLSLR